MRFGCAGKDRGENDRTSAGASVRDLFGHADGRTGRDEGDVTESRLYCGGRKKGNALGDVHR